MSTAPVSFSELEAAVKPAVAAEPQATPVAAEPVAPPQFTDQDIQTLRTFADAGITIQNYQQLLQANTLVQKLPDILRTNPKVLLDEISKADPQAYKNFLEVSSDEWWEKIGKNDPKNQRPAQGNASSVTSSPDPRIDQLQSQLQGVISELNQEKSAKQQARIMTGYNDSVSAMLSKLPEGVPESSKDYIRLKTQELVYKDEAARDRVAKGVYVDLPKYFAEASAKATADIKASAGKEHAARAAVEARSGKEITPAAEPVNGTQTGPNEDPIWGDAGLIRDTQAAVKSAR